VQLRPDLVEPQLGLFKLYGFLIRHGDTQQVISWLAQQNNDHARYFIGEALRRGKKLAAADSVLHFLLTRPLAIPTPPVYLSLAKIYYRLDLPVNAEQCYWEAVNEIQNQLGADLVFEEIKYLISDDELGQYCRLASIAAWQDFFRTFWLRHNPLSSTIYNFRLAEHFKRLLTAEENYEFDGFRTWFNNPDKYHILRFPQAYKLNQELNDKGMIYIRLGEPSETETTIGENIPTNESWLYKRSQTTPEMTFHFVKENAAGNNWRFIPYLTDPEMLEDRMQWDPNYNQMLQAEPTEQLMLQQKMAAESKASVMAGLTTERQTWTKDFATFDMPFSCSTFRGEQGNTLVELYYAIPKALLSKISTDYHQPITLASGMAVYDWNWRQVFKDNLTFEFPQVTATTTDWLDLYHLSVLPDSYHVAIHASVNNGNLLGGYQFDYKLDDYNKPELALSDLLLAETIEPTTNDSKFIKNGLKILPSPTRLFSLSKPVYIYFEIYQLQPNEQNQTSFSIEYKLACRKLHRRGMQKLFGFLSKNEQSSVSIQYDREGTTEKSVEYLAIDVSRLQAGDYDLTITISDRQHSNKSTQKTTHLTLFK